MLIARRNSSPLYRWIMTTAAVLIAMAQVAVTLLPLTELPHGAGERSRVEVPTSSGQYAHDEATCTVCQVLHSCGLLQPLPPLAVLVAWREQSQLTSWQPVSTAERLLEHSRAPPV